ncbi:MAG: hypothetical protein N3E47_05855 [Candidatus Bathyarchaeota archaeon]|nr:hypothetical protein [Candidatus Bathyarchaeota archaeon]
MALKKHKCYCCGRVIRKGDSCFVFIVAPLNPEKSEFEVIYTCLNCLNEESCVTRIREREGLMK